MDALFPPIYAEVINKNKNKIKKESMPFIYYILEELYKSNHLFFNITGSDLTYKDIISFLKNMDPSFIGYLNLYKEGPFAKPVSNTDIILYFIDFIKNKLIESFRFEVVVFFYEEKTDCFCLNVLLCLKSFGFDDLSIVTIPLHWVLRSVSLLLSMKHVVSLGNVKTLFCTNFIIKEFSIYYNSTFVFNINSHQRLGFPYFLYSFIRTFFESYNLTCFINPVYEVGGTSVSFPNCSYIDSDTQIFYSIINILVFYLILEGCFLDLNTNLFYKKNSKSKSTVVLLGSLSDLKKNYLYIVFYLKSYISNKYAYDYEFSDANFPLFPVSFTLLDKDCVNIAFKLIEKNLSLLQCINTLVFDIIEYKNGYYSIRDNFFYSYSFLKCYLPDNNIEINNFISYNYQDRLYVKKNIYQHELMFFLKNDYCVNDKDFLNFLDLTCFSKINTDSFIDSFSIIYMNSSMKFVFIKFLKHVYYNHPFIFLEYSKEFLTLDQLKFSKELPLFIIIDKIDETLISFLYNITKSSCCRPSSIILIVDTLLLDFFKFNSSFIYNFINLNTSFFHDFCKLIEKYNFSFDLFIILNNFFLKKNKLKPKKLFLKNYKNNKG